MAKSKAISPELRGIFNKIESQADEYNKAFNELNKLFRDSNRIKRENKELIIHNEDLLKRNLELCEKLENIENYISQRMQQVAHEAIEYFEENVITEILKKSNQVIYNFENQVENIVESVEGSRGIIELAEKMRNIIDSFDQHTIAMKDIMSQISNLKSTYTQYETEMNDSVLATKKSLKNIRQDVDTAFDTANYAMESKLKTIVKENKDSIRVLNRKISILEQKIEHNTKNVEPQQSIIQLIDTINIRIDELTRKLLSRIEAIEKKNNH